MPLKKIIVATDGQIIWENDKHLFGEGACIENLIGVVKSGDTKYVLCPTYEEALHALNMDKWDGYMDLTKEGVLKSDPRFNKIGEYRKHAAA